MTAPLSIIFMGTPDFAVPTLKALHLSPFDLKYVVTQPDRPKGRGCRHTSSPVKKIALELGYEVMQPVKVRDPSFIRQLKQTCPDLLVVVAFGQILPESVLSIPRIGALNVHGSLLPKFRGPAPIQWAILREEKITGVTTILMDQGVDTGDMLLHAQTPIHVSDSSATLHNRLSQMGADLLVQTIDGMSQGTVFPRSQRHHDASYAPMLKKEDGHIRWHESAHKIDALIRAMTPWPGAYCLKDGKRYKIHNATIISHISQSPMDKTPGTIIPGFPDELRVATGNGIISIIEIQKASGKRMPIKQFLRGHPISAGEMFT